MHTSAEQTAELLKAMAKAGVAQTAKRLQPLVAKLQALVVRRFPKLFGG